jgi:hypothetical protein
MKPMPLFRKGLFCVFLFLRTIADASDNGRETMESAQGPEALSSRFHVQAGGLFTSDRLSIPGTGRPWFGGSIQGGYALTRFGKSGEILVSGGLDWADPDPAGYVALSPDFAAGRLAFAWQILDRDLPGIGYRMEAGVGRFFTGQPDTYPEKLFPIFSMTGIAQSSTGIYFYLELGSLILSPIVIGMGLNL